MDIQKELLLWVGAALVCAMVVSFIMCPLVKSFAYKIGAIDVPKDNRRMHKKTCRLCCTFKVLLIHGSRPSVK